jgi:hypothetical protein
MVGSQRQVDAIYFDLSNALDLVPHPLRLHLLKFSPVFLRDLSWDPFTSMCLLMTCAMQLPILSDCFLLMTLKFTEPLVLLRTAIYFSLTLTVYKVGALLTV